MKIRGPNSGSPPRPIDEPRNEATTAKLGPSKFDTTLRGERAGATPTASTASAAQQPRYAAQIEAVVAQLRNGEISATQALDSLVSAVVKTRGGLLPEPLRANLTRALARVIESDPYLLAQLRRMDDQASR